MLGKICAGPKSGASSSGLTEYLVAYAVAGKGASRAEIAAAIEAVELEAEGLDDQGHTGRSLACRPLRRGRKREPPSQNHAPHGGVGSPAERSPTSLRFADPSLRAIKILVDRAK